MKELAVYIKPYKKAVAAAVFFMVVDVLAEIMQPMLMARIVGKGITEGDFPFILFTGGCMIVLAFISILAGVGNSRFSAKAGVGFAANLRRGLFEKVQEFSFQNIDHFSTASLSTRLTNDVTLMQNTVIMGMRLIIRAPMMLVFAVIMAVRMSVSLSMVLEVVIPLLLIGVSLIISRAMPLFNQMQSKVDMVNRSVQENVTNVRVVKSFVREDYEKKKFADASRGLMDASFRAMNLVILNMPMMMFLLNGSAVAVIWIGGNKIIHGNLDVASMTAFINYIMMILMSLMMISMVFIMLSRASASYRRIREVLGEEVDLESPESAFCGETSRSGAAEGKASIRGEVVFDKVAFRYSTTNEGEQILSDISFRAQPGQVVAIIGGTGSGKSSLVQLIPRLYDVTEGQVLVDGKDVREYDLTFLRNQIGMVLQKNTLFSGTIRENLKWGDAEAAEEEMIQAAKNAQAHDFIMGFPQGYDTWMEQGGVNVSGGQKQRLCIARAMLKKPAILILDDSTSAVDTATEKKIRQAFSSALKHTTTFIIAQRISSVEEADQIIVLDDGRIAGIGTHSELLGSCAEYREIYESQMGKEAVCE